MRSAAAVPPPFAIKGVGPCERGLPWYGLETGGEAAGTNCVAAGGGVGLSLLLEAVGENKQRT